VFSRYERKIGEVSRDVWQRMLEIAHGLDLNKGGIYDARSGAINLWVAPEDKPLDYVWEIRKGALSFPRNFLASIYGQFTEDGDVELYLVIYNYARKDYAEYLFNHSNISYKEYRAMLDLAEKGTDAEWSWAMAKAKWLIDMAVKESVFIDVTYCPFCGQEFPNLQIFNDFIMHLLTHTKIRNILGTDDGWAIETEKGILFPDDYIRKKTKKAQ
jgi:hypothetical protein